jgi:hypothetical protein
LDSFFLCLSLFFSKHKAPWFDNSKKTENNKYVANFGDQITCRFEYDPIQFKSKENNSKLLDLIIDEEFPEKLSNYALVFRKEASKKIMKIKRLEKEAFKIKRNIGSKLIFVVRGELKIETEKLNFFDSYSCCLENLNENKLSDGKTCSFVELNSLVIVKTNENQRNIQIVLEKPRKDLNNRMMYILIAALFIVLCALVLLLRVAYKLFFSQLISSDYTPHIEKESKNGLFLVLNGDTEHNEPAPSNIMDNLYVRYNLNSSFETKELSYSNDDLPSYTDFYGSKVNNDKF